MSTCVADARLRLACSLHLGGRALDALARQQRFARNKPRFEGRSLLLQHQRAAASPPREKRASHRTAGFAADAHAKSSPSRPSRPSTSTRLRRAQFRRRSAGSAWGLCRRATRSADVLSLARASCVYSLRGAPPRDARAEWNRSAQCEHAWRGVLHRGTARRCDKSRA